MADPLLAGRGMCRARVCLLKDALLEGIKLIRRKNEQKRLQEDDGFSKASIDVVMVRVHRLPRSSGVCGRAVEKIRNGVAVIRAEVLHHFPQGTDFGKKLEAVGQQDVVQETAHAGRFLASVPLKICRVKRGSVGNGAVVFGVFIEGTEQATQGSGEQKAKFRGNMNGLKGFAKTPVLAQLQSFIERDTKHNVVGFKCFDVVAENNFLFSGQPRAPVAFD